MLSEDYILNKIAYWENQLAQVQGSRVRASQGRGYEQYEPKPNRYSMFRSKWERPRRY